jgi:hypothetical protein
VKQNRHISDVDRDKERCEHPRGKAAGASKIADKIKSFLIKNIPRSKNFKLSNQIEGNLINYCIFKPHLSSDYQRDCPPPT